MDFWTRLKTGIKAQNTTQEWIAGKIGVPFGTFRKWMSRKTYPNIKDGIAIAKLLETSAEYLVTGTESESLTDTEQKLIQAWRRLGKADQENVLLAVNAWLEKRKK